ncbi:MAG: thioesterase family protein [Lachnospiraceae bacterium]|nr:thioesterase family protein [Lachnospiraceae bacterium]
MRNSGRPTLNTGIRGTIEKTVSSEMTAKSVGSGELEVLATPVLIALAEECSWKSVVQELDEGQGTVGTRMDLKHLSATPVGMSVNCTSELVEVDGRKLVFAIEAFDEAGKIAEATHERFIVDNEKFMSKAANKGKE